MKDSAVASTFALLYCVLLALLRFGTPLAQASYAVQDPMQIETIDPVLGSSLPSALVRHHPMIVAVHGQCLACTTQIDPGIAKLFANHRVLNVVTTPRTEEYRAIQQGIPGAKVLYMPAEKVDPLVSPFSPRIYAFDGHGKLRYIETTKAEDVSKEVEHAINSSR